MTGRSFLIALSVVCVGCGKRDTSDTGRPALTERQQDSILARSSIPGASAVGRAMRAADSTSARIRGDSASP